jgi:DDE superfamily endonuclease/Helix-turn-helix of DDE superfamily endonuclease
MTTLQYYHLRGYAPVFLSMTGLRVEEFDTLAKEVLPQFEGAESQRLARTTRQRAVGGGEKPHLDSRDQLLLTIIWLRQYPTHDVLGFFFGVSQPTVGRYIERMLPILEQAGRDTMRGHDPGRKRRRSLAALLDDVPDLARVVDSFEQRVQRPKVVADRDGWYSGKKRMHTVKSQIVVESESGWIRNVADSVKGRVSDIKLIEVSRVLDHLPNLTGMMGDAAYQGIAKLHALGCSPCKKPIRGELTEMQIAYNHAFSQRRIIVETIINRLRRYQSLTQMDRQHRQTHTARVCAVAGLVNRQLRHRMAA